MTPGPLNSIFAVVNPVITANLAVNAITPTFGMSGPERVSEFSHPRVVWVPTDEDISKALGQGGDIVVDGQGNQNLPNGALPPLYARTSNVECDLWGADRDTVEVMINATVSAVHDCLFGAFGITAARWLLPEESGKDGETYRLTFQFGIPIIRVQPGTTTATTTSIPLTPSSTFHVGP